MSKARWRRAFAGALVVMSAGLARAEDPAGPDRYAITGGRVFTGTGDPIEGATVVIDGGLVRAVGAGVEAPAGAWVIDASGKNVYPGFIDALGSLGLAKSAEGEGNGDGDAPFAAGPEDRPATTTWREAADELVFDDEEVQSWRRAGFTSSVSAPAEGIFPGQASVVNLAGERPRDRVVATPVALRVNLTPQDSRRSFPGSLMGVLAYVRQVFLDAEHYRASWSAYEDEPLGRKRPTYDRALEPVAAALASDRPVLFPAHLRHEIVRVVELAREVGARPVVYGAHEAHAAADVLKEANVPVIVSLAWPERRDDADPEEQEPLRVLRLRESAPGTPAALEEAGVRFAFSTEGLEEPGDALSAVRRARERGLSETEAVRALTLSAAEIYGLDDRMGSLEPGKIANLVLAEGDVFSEDGRVTTVFVDGKKLDVPARVDTEEEEK